MYDGIGRRIKRISKQGSTVVRDQRYIWSGAEICWERTTIPGVNPITKRFFSQGVKTNSTLNYYTRDHLGSVREVTDSSGNVVSRYDYDPWGRQTVVTGTTVFDIGYAGYWNLHSAGSILNLKLNLTWYRAYSPELGRWLSRDPIGEEGGINLYAYVENNPINFYDPTGLILLICYRKAWGGGINPIQLVGQHSYFYWPSPDGKPEKDQQCGRYKGKPVREDPRNENPRNTVCYEVPGTEGREKEILDCCEQKNSQDRMYLPGKSDCQTDTTDCLRDKGLAPPLGNPGRFRPPGQSVRGNGKGTPYVFR